MRSARPAARRGSFTCGGSSSISSCAISASRRGSRVQRGARHRSQEAARCDPGARQPQMRGSHPRPHPHARRDRRSGQALEQALSPIIRVRAARRARVGVSGILRREDLKNEWTWLVPSSNHRRQRGPRAFRQRAREAPGVTPQSEQHKSPARVRAVKRCEPPAPIGKTSHLPYAAEKRCGHRRG